MEQGKKGDKGKILLIDDNELLQDLGRDILEHLGYTPVIASGGEEGIEIYSREKEEIRAVLLDVVMPGLGGLEVLKRLKEINPQVKVLVISGYSEEKRAGELLEEGAMGFIQKPFKIGQLSQKLQEILEEK
jgi:two-component system cell cycle sensor histidine kinase/response regulator CckA